MPSPDFQLAKNTVRGGGIPQPARKGREILIVEDDAVMRGLLRAALEGEYRVRDAATAKEGFEAALQESPAVILLDLSLPDASGLDLCRTFSSLSFTRQIPIVVISGQPAADYEDPCLRLGAKAYLEKPVEPARLRRVLASVFEQPATERRAGARSDVRLVLKLVGVDGHGDPLEGFTITEDLSSRGFTCSCTTLFEEDAAVEVRMAREDRRVGRACVVRRQWPNAAWKRYAFQFLEEPRGWPALNR